MTKQIIPINEIQNSFIFSFYAYLEISKEQQEDVNMTSVSKYQTHRCSTALFFCSLLYSRFALSQKSDSALAVPLLSSH